MKIAVTGKGGVGKDHFCSNACQIVCSRREDRYLQQMWIRMQILVWHLGFDEETLDSIVPISKMRKLVEERTGATARKSVLSSESESRRYPGEIW